MERSLVGVIIPAFNEAATIESVVLNVNSHAIAIVVDDGSVDDTADNAARAGAEVVKHEINRGYDSALNSGFAAAAAMGCEVVVTMDADGQHNPAQLQEYLRHLGSGYDLVLGVRDRLQRVGETLFAAVGKRLWGISDPLCGMKGYRMETYRTIGVFDSFRSIGTELAVRSVASGYRFIELPVLTRDRRDAPRFGRRFGANMKIIRALLILVGLQLSGQLKSKIR